MMILVTAFAVLFAVLKTFGAPPAAFIVVTIFVGGIAACQSLLFKGKKPRLASFVGGMVMVGLLNLVIEGVGLFFYVRFYGPASIVSFLFRMAMQTVLFGGGLGYIVGCFIASIFLVRKEPDDAEPVNDDVRRTEIQANAEEAGGKLMDVGSKCGNETDKPLNAPSASG